MIASNQLIIRADGSMFHMACGGEETPVAQKPEAGSATGRQQAGGVIGSLPGFGPALSGTYENYRKMSSDPTLALARMVVTAPVLAGSWGFTAHEDAPADALDVIKAAIEPMRPLIVRECLRSLEYGWQPFEKVWQVVDNLWTVRKLKPLLPDVTQIVVADDGSFAGLQNNGVDLAPIKSFVCTYDGEAGNFYGRSRHENARKEWSRREDVDERSAQYAGKVAGVYCVIHYPPGKSLDAAGSEVENFVLAQRLGEALMKGKPVYCPNLFAAANIAENPEQAAALAGKGAWVIEFKDSGGASHATGFIEKLKYHDSRLFRAWLRPERSAMEGQFGTKAEAEAHGDVGLIDCELIDADIARQLNWYIIDDMLAVNWGEQARGSVVIVPAPIIDKNRAVMTKILDAILGNPGTLELFLSTFDADTMHDQFRIPVTVDHVDWTGGAGATEDEKPLTAEEAIKLQEQMKGIYVDPPVKDVAD